MMMSGAGSGDAEAIRPRLVPDVGVGGSAAAAAVAVAAVGRQNRKLAGAIVALVA